MRTRCFAVVAAICVSIPALASEKVAAQTQAIPAVQMQTGATEKVQAPGFMFHFTCTDAAGNVRWSEDVHNTVLTGGGNDLLDKYFKGSAYTAAWYMALKGTGTIAATDVWTSHAGWTEVTPYTGNRPAITFGTTSARSNTATAVSYSINASATVAGACVSSSNTGTTGVLYSCSDFAASRSVVSGDTLNVTLTVSD